MADVVFCVDSYGGTATKWLAACFNAHPRIACAHSFFWPPALPRLDGDPVPETAVWRRESCWDVDEFFARFRRLAPDAACRGTVHAFPVSTAGAWRGPEEMRVAYLLRHPVLQVESIVEAWRHRCRVDPPFRARLLADFLARVHEASLARRVDLAPVVAAVWDEADIAPALGLMATVDVFESHRRAFVEAPHVPVFTMERLTAEPAELERLFRHCTADRLPDAGAVARRVAAAPAINRHRAAPRTAAEVFAGWPAWRQLLFHVAFAAELGGRYAALGYALPVPAGLEAAPA